MAEYIIQKSTTSQLVEVLILDTSGAPMTGLLFSTSGLVCNFYKSGTASDTSITLITMTLGTWVSGGFIEIDSTGMPGWYQLGLPNATLSSSSNRVTVVLSGATLMGPTAISLDMVGYNPYDGVRLGLTALPNAAASSAGGLPTLGTGSGQISLSSGLVFLAASQTASITGNLSGSVGSVTGNVGGNLLGTLTSTERDLIAAALLKLDWTTITGEASRSALNALRSIRNKVSISASTLTVCEEDDSTAAWTAALTTNPAAVPITSIDPA